MKTNYIFKARWLQGVASENGSKKMRVNPRRTPVRFAFALLMLTICSGNAWGVSVAYDFSIDSNNPGNGNNWFSGSIGEYATWSATKGGTNNPQYYDTGSGLRIYNGGKFTITSTLTMSSITLTFSGTGYTFSTSNTTTPQTVSPNATSYEWSVSRTCRLQKIEITFASGGCNAIDLTGETSALILPAGSTTYNTSDWGRAGAPGAYPTSATTYSIGDDAYCISLMNVADFKDATGIRFKASSGVMEIADIVSDHGIDVEFVGTGTNGFQVELTGATTKTAQTGTITISTTSTTATLKISKNTSTQGNVTYIKITPKAAPTCFNAVTLAHNSPTNGTVSFSPSGPIETCDGTVNTTMTITPATGYTLTAFNYSTGSGSVSPSNQSPGAPNVTTNSATPQAITLTFAQNANGTCTANATFSKIAPTAWSWTYNSAAIPNPINLYVGQTAALVATYTPNGLLNSEKDYDITKSSGLTQVSKTYAVTNPTYTFRADEVMDDGTITLTNIVNTSLTITVHVHVNPLPLVHFVDIVHGYEFADVVGTIEANALAANKTTPTHAEYSGTGANDCETDHTRLVGWIEKTWTDAHPDASHSDIIGAGAGVFVEANAAINVLTYNGNTYYAVWAKLQ